MLCVLCECNRKNWYIWSEFGNTACCCTTLGEDNNCTNVIQCQCCIRDSDGNGILNSLVGRCLEPFESFTSTG